MHTSCSGCGCVQLKAYSEIIQHTYFMTLFAQLPGYWCLLNSALFVGLAIGVYKQEFDSFRRLKHLSQQVNQFPRVEARKLEAPSARPPKREKYPNYRLLTNALNCVSVFSLCTQFVVIERQRKLRLITSVELKVGLFTGYCFDTVNLLYFACLTADIRLVSSKCALAFQEQRTQQINRTEVADCQHSH